MTPEGEERRGEARVIKTAKTGRARPACAVLTGAGGVRGVGLCTQVSGQAGAHRGSSGGRLTVSGTRSALAVCARLELAGRTG